MSDTVISLWVEAKRDETWRNTEITTNAALTMVYQSLAGFFVNPVKALAGLAFLLAEERTCLRKVTL